MKKLQTFFGCHLGRPGLLNTKSSKTRYLSEINYQCLIDKIEFTQNHETPNASEPSKVDVMNIDITRNNIRE